MTVVIAILAIAVLVLTFLVAGLLRSHAAILRQLESVGAGLGRDAAQPDAAQSRAASRSSASDLLDLPRPGAHPEGRPAPDIAGATPSGDAVGVRLAGARHDTILVFLSSGCRTCRPFWEALREGEIATAGARLVVVTKGPEDESPTAIEDLAPAAYPVVMSSDAWSAYGVPGSPYVVHVDGRSATVRGEGTAADVETVLRMHREAAGDIALDQARDRKAAGDRAREREVDRALLDAGIGPDHPSLYPDRSSA